MLIIKVPIVRVSCGITPNITNAITPTINTIVRSRLIGLASFPAILFSFFTFLKIVFSKKLIGTFVRNAIAPPSINGNTIPHIAFSTPSTTSNFHRATTRNAVNTISSLIFFIDILFKSTIFLPFLIFICYSKLIDRFQECLGILAVTVILSYHRKCHNHNSQYHQDHSRRAVQCLWSCFVGKYSCDSGPEKCKDHTQNPY